MVMAKAGAAGCRMSPTTCVGSDVGGGGLVQSTASLPMPSAGEGTAQGTGGLS